MTAAIVLQPSGCRSATSATSRTQAFCESRARPWLDGYSGQVDQLFRLKADPHAPESAIGLARNTRAILRRERRVRLRAQDASSMNWRFIGFREEAQYAFDDHCRRNSIAAALRSGDCDTETWEARLAGSTRESANHRVLRALKDVNRSEQVLE